VKEGDADSFVVKLRVLSSVSLSDGVMEACCVRENEFVPVSKEDSERPV
jgi:hypothetical protein